MLTAAEVKRNVVKKRWFWRNAHPHGPAVVVESLHQGERESEKMRGSKVQPSPCGFTGRKGASCSQVRECGVPPTSMQ